MKSANRKIRSIVATLLAAVMVLSMSSFAYAADNTAKTADEIVKQINAEYGTNIHPLSEAELEKYGLSTDTEASTEKTDLKVFEAELRYIAEVEIPRFERDTQEAMAKSAAISEVLVDAEKNTFNSKSSPIVATKAINYATAGATAYTTTNGYGAKIWGSVVNTFCSSNMYSSRWFMALYPSVTKIDGGRTLYWEGTGDYCAYINGTQYYLYSGTQYAEMYVGSYS